MIQDMMKHEYVGPNISSIDYFHDSFWKAEEARIFLDFETH